MLLSTSRTNVGIQQSKSSSARSLKISYCINQSLRDVAIAAVKPIPVISLHNFALKL